MTSWHVTDAAGTRAESVTLEHMIRSLLAVQWQLEFLSMQLEL